MGDLLPDLCKSALRKIYGSDLDKYNIVLEGKGLPGEGYSNEMIYLKLKNGETEVHLVMKMMLEMQSESIREFIKGVYDTETRFYEVIWPKLDELQKNHQSQTKLFDKIPKFFGSFSENGQTVLVMENLKATGFTIRKNDHRYDKSLVEIIFKSFANFHALSLALKDKNLAEFDELGKTIPNMWANFSQRHIMLGMVSQGLDKLLPRLEGDKSMIDRSKRLAENIVEEFDEVGLYKGTNNVISHGDCWINNFLFKYNESGEIEDHRCLDFQQTQLGTPVYDLSYFFYSGATKSLLDDLEYFLLIYHDTLSTKLQDLGCDVNTLYPYEALKDEWKKYSKFGFIMSFVIWRVKLSKTILEFKDSETENTEQIKAMVYDETKYLEVIQDLIEHMYTNAFF